MFRKLKSLLVILCVFLFSGCSLSKSELREECKQLSEDVESLDKKILEYKSTSGIFDFYNSITTENISAFVVVESKNNITSTTKYSNGVIIGFNSLKYYVLTDYEAIKQSGFINYRVMDKNANVYKANIATSNYSVDYDEYSGLVLLEVNVSSYNNTVMDSIELGEKSDLVASFSSVSQLNKVQLLDNIKTSTLMYNDASYDVYNFENTIVDSGTILINEDNQLCAMYMSKLDTFISVNLIKNLVYATYLLVL